MQPPAALHFTTSLTTARCACALHLLSPAYRLSPVAWPGLANTPVRRGEMGHAMAWRRNTSTGRSVAFEGGHWRCVVDVLCGCGCGCGCGCAMWMCIVFWMCMCMLRMSFVTVFTLVIPCPFSLPGSTRKVFGRYSTRRGMGPKRWMRGMSVFNILLQTPIFFFFFLIFILFYFSR